MIFFAITLSILNAFLVMHLPLLKHPAWMQSFSPERLEILFYLSTNSSQRSCYEGYLYKSWTRTAAYKHTLYMNGKGKSNFLVFKVSLLLSTFDHRSWTDINKEIRLFLTQDSGCMYDAVYTWGWGLFQTCVPQCPLSRNTLLVHQ